MWGKNALTPQGRFQRKQYLFSNFEGYLQWSMQLFVSIFINHKCTIRHFLNLTLTIYLRVLKRGWNIFKEEIMLITNRNSSVQIFFVVFEFRISHLLGRHTTSWDTPLDLGVQNKKHKCIFSFFYPCDAKYGYL
jgi:hypothetical protein